MIPVSEEVKAAFQSDSVIKKYVLEFQKVVNSKGETVKEEKKYTASQYVSESATLTEPMCSEEQLKYGQCEAATFEIELEYSADSLVGRIFNLYLILGDDDEQQNPFVVGRYIVDTEEIESGRLTKTITAYDVLYILKMLDVTAWYFTQEFPMTVKQFRDSLMSYVNQQQEEVTLINDDRVIRYDPLINENQISFDTLMTGLCEINGCFGHINRDGKFDYKTLTPQDNEELYPDTELEPSEDLEPNSIRGRNYYISPNLTKSDISWQNYMCKTVDKVQVRSRSGQVLYEYKLPDKSTETNIYVIQNNWIVDAFDSNDLMVAILNFGEFIRDVTYKPVNANVKMDLSLEVGDAITLVGTDGSLIPTFILNRTATGICSAFDEFDITGYEEWVNESPSNDGMVSELADELSDLTDRVDALENEDHSLTILSVEHLPEAPKKNTLYLIQGRVTVM